MDDDAPTEEVGPRRDRRDAVQDCRPTRLDDHLVRVGVELARGGANARGEPCDGVTLACGQSGEVVVGQHPGVVGANHQVAAVLGTSPQGGLMGVEQQTQDAGGCALGTALDALQDEYGIGAAKGVKGHEAPAHDEAEIVV